MGLNNGAHEGCLKIIRIINMSKKKKKADVQPTQEKAVVQPSKEILEKNQRILELDKLRITSETVLPHEQAVLSVDGVPIFELGDIGALKAKQKAGKTTTLKVMTGCLMKGELFRLKSEIPETKVIWLDTEQKLSDVKDIVNDIIQMTGLDADYVNHHLRVYSFRTLSHKTLLSDTRTIISSYHPHVLIIDGVVDYVESFNDETLSHNLINELIRLSDEFHCAIINVLHENKSGDDHNMRGHLGTMLAQKSGTVLQCKKQENEVITVTCSDSRHRAMPDWAIRYDEFGHIVSADGYDGPKVTANQLEEQRRLGIIKGIIQNSGGSIARKDLTIQLMEILNLKRPTVANMITNLVKSSLSESDGRITLQPNLELEFEWPV